MSLTSRIARAWNYDPAGHFVFVLGAVQIIFWALFFFLSFSAFAQTVLVDPTVPGPKTAAESIIAYILVPLIPVLGALLAAALTKLTTYLHAKESNSKVAAAFAIATDFVSAAFTRMRAGIEPDLRMALADGSLDAMEREHLVAKLVALVKAELPAGIMAILGGALGPALETWLNGKAGQVIQAAVAETPTGVASVTGSMALLEAAGRVPASPL